MVPGHCVSTVYLPAVNLSRHASVGLRAFLCGCERDQSTEEGLSECFEHVQACAAFEFHTIEGRLVTFWSSLRSVKDQECLHSELEKELSLKHDELLEKVTIHSVVAVHSRVSKNKELQQDKNEYQRLLEASRTKNAALEHTVEELVAHLGMLLL